MMQKHYKIKPGAQRTLETFKSNQGPTTLEENDEKGCNRVQQIIVTNSAQFRRFYPLTFMTI